MATITPRKRLISGILAPPFGGAPGVDGRETPRALGNWPFSQRRNPRYHDVIGPLGAAPAALPSTGRNQVFTLYNGVRWKSAKLGRAPSSLARANRSDVEAASVRSCTK